MARKDKVDEQVRDLITEVTASLGLELYDLVFKRSGPRWKLQVFLVRPGDRISLDDCAQASRAISRELDLVDPIPHAYDLEVSSPGLDRPLRNERHWAGAQGEKVRVRWRDEAGKMHTTVGVAVGIEDRTAQVTSGDDAPSTRIPLESIVSAKLEVEW